jgi:subtilisin family serine protease
MTKEYIVSLKKEANYDEFWNQIESESLDDGFVPDRRVDIVNERPGSLRSCHYALTDVEAEKLRNDPRVYSVEIPPDQRTDIQIGHRYNSRNGNFSKTDLNEGDYLNWGLRRCIDYINPYGTGDSVTGDFHYVNDGTGVDIVIQDSGVQHEHPELLDDESSFRVQLIDWYDASGLVGTQSVNHYRDLDGHGTHVAGIASGRTYGWAPNARIYSVKVRGLEGAGDTDPISGLGSGIVTTDCFDVIKLWHQNKPVDPVTGFKRPTVVNMSWGYFSTYSSITGGSYRGTPWTDTVRKTEYGMVGVLAGLGQYAHNIRVGSIDSDVQEMIDAGIIVCVAAGNSYDKIDTSLGTDYNNYYTNNFGNRYYHRGASPRSEDAINVGSIDSAVPVDLEQKADYSCAGPGVDIWAPGSNVMSCTSNTNRFTSESYYGDAAYKQVNISGTSMASPQVAGVAALYLQSNPGATPADVKSFLQAQSNLAGPDRLDDSGLDDDYTNDRSLLGSSQQILYWPYAQGNPEGPAPVTASVGGAISFSGAISIRFI